MTFHPYHAIELAASRQARYLDEAATARLVGRRPSWLSRLLATLRRRRRLTEPAPARAESPYQPAVVVGDEAVVGDGATVVVEPAALVGVTGSGT